MRSWAGTMWAGSSWVSPGGSRSFLFLATYRLGPQLSLASYRPYLVSLVL